MSDIHSKPIAERIDWLFELALRHSKIFCSPEAWLSREQYLSEHPTAIAVLKCMDGRINIPVATHTPAGILMPFRNLGGMFDLGWLHLGEVLSHHIFLLDSQPGYYATNLARWLKKCSSILQCSTGVHAAWN